MSTLYDREFNQLKVLHHFDRLRALANDRDIAPVTVEIDPVAYCNHACVWCVDPIHHSARMSEATFDSLIGELAEFDVEEFRVEGIVFKGGGEPTLHPCFRDFVERAAARGFAVGCVTNGSRLDLAADVLANHAAYVRVSIDGPTPKSHARIHHSHDFERIVAGVKQLVRRRNGRRHPLVGLCFAMDINMVDLAEEAIRLGEQLDVDYVLLRPPFFEEVGSAPTMTLEEARQVRKRLAEAAARHRGGLDIMVGNWISDTEQRAVGQCTMEASGRRALHLASNLPIEHRTGRCPASPLLAVVAADGEVYGCCNLRALPEWAFGRLDYEHGIGFRELWNGAARQEKLARMHDTKCIKHCTHPLSRYNEIIEVLHDSERPHSEFV